MMNSDALQRFEWKNRVEDQPLNVVKQSGRVLVEESRTKCQLCGKSTGREEWTMRLEWGETKRYEDLQNICTECYAPLWNSLENTGPGHMLKCFKIALKGETVPFPREEFVRAVIEGARKTYGSAARLPRVKKFLKGRKDAPCEVCGTVSAPMKVCSGCRIEIYCSESCQREDWKSHKTACDAMHEFYASMKELMAATSRS